MIYKIRQLLTFFNADISDNANAEKARRIYVVNLFSFVGMTITFIMATSALLQGNWPLVVVLYIASSIFLIGLIAQKYAKNTSLAARVVLYSLVALLLYLVHTGGVEGTGPLWIYILAPVSYFIHGLKRGTFDNLMFAAIVSVLLFYPSDVLLHVNYSFEFKTRLILSYLTVAFLSGYYEHTRFQAFKHTLEISRKFEQLAKIDPLTGLSNRRDALEKVDYELNRSTRTKEPLGILLCDIDHFKQVNDEYGHHVGDDVLVALAKFLINESRAMDIIARWGGEEFLIVLPQTDIAHSALYAEKLLAKLRDFEIKSGKHTLKCTMSVGISQFEKKSTIEHTLKQADDALYRAKGSGRNQVCTANS